mmetsp:Transcript_11911/g.11456  ORF Transcript_11911/g.11456 Transcript_11911/m.11456 type:complete len:264 (+) Transcript_11911:2910-3701(+)
MFLNNATFDYGRFFDRSIRIPNTEVESEEDITIGGDVGSVSVRINNNNNRHNTTNCVRTKDTCRTAGRKISSIGDVFESFELPKSIITLTPKYSLRQNSDNIFEDCEMNEFKNLINMGVLCLSQTCALIFPGPSREKFIKHCALQILDKIDDYGGAMESYQEQFQKMSTTLIKAMKPDPKGCIQKRVIRAVLVNGAYTSGQLQKLGVKHNFPNITGTNIRMFNKDMATILEGKLIEQKTHARQGFSTENSSLLSNPYCAKTML